MPRARSHVTIERVRRRFDMSEIVITGSTGVIGRRAVRELLAAGYRVTGVTRSARGRERLEGLGAHAVEADVFDQASLRRAFDGADAVVNLLTHIPSAERMADPSAWAENDRMRTEASAAVAGAARAAGARRLVQESIAFVYADGGDAWLDGMRRSPAGRTTSRTPTRRPTPRSMPRSPPRPGSKRCARGRRTRGRWRARSACRTAGCARRAAGRRASARARRSGPGSPRDRGSAVAGLRRLASQALEGRHDLTGARGARGR